MNKKEIATKKQYVFRGKIINLRNDEVLLPNGKCASREVVEHPDGVCILPVDDDGNVYLVSQYRYACGCEMLEIPAGKCEKGEEPIETARRELDEEVGFKAGKMMFIGEFPAAPGYSTEKYYIFMAKDLQPTNGRSDDDEFLDTIKMTWSDALQKIKKN